MFRFVSQNVRKMNGFLFNVFWCCGCVLYNELLFKISDSNSLYLTVYGNMPDYELFEMTQNYTNALYILYKNCYMFLFVCLVCP